MVLVPNAYAQSTQENNNLLYVCLDRDIWDGSDLAEE